MRFGFIEQHARTWPVRLMCRVLRVSASGYYAWRSRPESHRAIANRRLLQEVHRLHAQHQGRYGSPRMHAALRYGRHPQNLCQEATATGEGSRSYNGHGQEFTFEGETPMYLFGVLLTSNPALPTPHLPSEALSCATPSAIPALSTGTLSGDSPCRVRRHSGEHHEPLECMAQHYDPLSS